MFIFGIFQYVFSTIRDTTSSNNFFSFLSIIQVFENVKEEMTRSAKCREFRMSRHTLVAFDDFEVKGRSLPMICLLT